MSCTCVDSATSTYLPDKVGELVSAMFYCGTLSCLVKICTRRTPENIEFTSHGLYVTGVESFF